MVSSSFLVQCTAVVSQEYSSVCSSGTAACLQEMESRTQGSRSRPRTALRRTDPLEAKGGNARGQGHGQGHNAEVISKKDKKRFSSKNL